MLEFDNKKKKILTISLLVYAVVLLLLILMLNFEKFNSFTAWMNDKLSVFTPILIGAVISYLCNPLVHFFQNTVLKRSKSKVLKRGLSIFLAYFLIFVIITIFGIMIIPQLISSINDLITKLTDGTYLNMVLNATEKIIEKIFTAQGNEFTEPVFDMDKIYGVINDAWIKFQNIDIFESGFQGVEIIGSYASKIFNGIKNIFFGLLLSVYFTIGKEKIYAQIKKIMHAFFSKEKCDSVYEWFRFADKTFGGFIVGKILDALFMIFMCSIVFSIANIPYAILISVVIGLFNIIPFFGPFIGIIPSALIVLISDPKKFLIFVILILIIQQVDANIVEPKIVGSRTGLSSLGVIVAILIMNGYLGLVGMFFGVPIFAILYSLVQKFIDIRLSKKELKTDLADYYSETSIVDPRREVPSLSSRFVHFCGKHVRIAERKLMKHIKKSPSNNEENSLKDENNEEKRQSQNENLNK